MARSTKVGLDYFPMDTTWDRKMKLFKAKYKLLGIGLITEILKTIYNDEGYYYPWDDETSILFADEHSIDELLLSEMVDYAIEKGIFDIGIYEKYNILTSTGIQKRYFNSSLKRNQVVFIKEILLIDPQKPNWSNMEILLVSLKSISDTGNAFKEPQTIDKDTAGTQSKVKETRVKETRVNSMSSTEADLDDVDAFIKGQEEKKENIPYKEIIDYLNKHAKTDYSHTTTATKSKIKARWNEGFRLKDFKIVIDAKVRSWLTDEKMVIYLRPDTLFSASKFEGYLQEGLKHKPKARCNNCGLTDGYHTESCQLYVKTKEEIKF